MQWDVGDIWDYGDVKVARSWGEEGAALIAKVESGIDRVDVFAVPGKSTGWDEVLCHVYYITVFGKCMAI